MFGAKAAQKKEGATEAQIFRRIGAFLVANGLSPEPGHYAFAWHVLRDADGPLAREVAHLTEDGVRLSRQDIERLGGEVTPGAPAQVEDDSRAAASPADTLVARTQEQVAGFTTMVRDMQDEARGFGRDLAASAEAMRRTGDPLGIDDVVRLTGAMVERVRQTEQRLVAATQEADSLRAQLEEAHGSARRDPLTGLANRRGFEEAFAALDPAVPACVAICDVDRFKQVNDRFGHGVGDRVLKAIGQRLAQHCGDHLVARHGGEEFAVLVTGVTLAEAADLLDDTRAAVGARRLRLRETDAAIGTVTFSGGVAALLPGESLDAALARADRALYLAKAAGRDRIEIAPDVGG